MYIYIYIVKQHPIPRRRQAKARRTAGAHHHPTRIVFDDRTNNSIGTLVRRTVMRFISQVKRHGKTAVYLRDRRAASPPHQWYPNTRQSVFM